MELLVKISSFLLFFAPVPLQLPIAALTTRSDPIPDMAFPREGFEPREDRLWPWEMEGASPGGKEATSVTCSAEHRESALTAVTVQTTGCIVLKWLPTDCFSVASEKKKQHTASTQWESVQHRAWMIKMNFIYNLNLTMKKHQANIQWGTCCSNNIVCGAPFRNTYIKIGMIQRRLALPPTQRWHTNLWNLKNIYV